MLRLCIGSREKTSDLHHLRLHRLLLLSLHEALEWLHLRLLTKLLLLHLLLLLHRWHSHVLLHLLRYLREVFIGLSFVIYHFAANIIYSYVNFVSPHHLNLLHGFIKLPLHFLVESLLTFNLLLKFWDFIQLVLEINNPILQSINLFLRNVQVVCLNSQLNSNLTELLLQFFRILLQGLNFLVFVLIFPF